MCAEQNESSQKWNYGIERKEEIALYIHFGYDLATVS
jgi:hypothetical protein